MAAGFLTGIEVLVRDHATWLRRARFGLVAHPASVTTRGLHSARVLAEDDRFNLSCLLGPEHGFTGAAGAGDDVADGHERALDLPVRSLYGKSRRPTARTLRDVDALVFDLQDLGVRCYTYVATLRYVLEAAAAQGKRVVVTDRPVPFANTVDGPMLDRSQESFVGCVPAPLVYGMTPGETARWLMDVLRLDVDLKVAHLQGYHRELRPRTDWPAWIPPSPAITSWASALCYPATVVSEALPALDAGRSGGHPFQVLRAPWIRSGEVRAALDALDLPGVGFEGLPCGRLDGLRLRVTDPGAFLPVSIGVAILSVLRDLYGDRAIWNHPKTRETFFDKLMGTESVREEIRSGESAAWVAAGWVKSRRVFEEQRRRHLLYDVPAGKEPRRRPRKTAARMPNPRKAVVLAAGFGTRMLPLSRDLPKPLMPLWGKSMLQHTLERLASWGVKDVVVNCHHLPGDILAFVRKGPVPDLRITLSFEPEILGTGGALSHMRWFFENEPFWLMNADIAADLDPERLRVDFHRRHRVASVWLHPTRGPRTVETRRGLVHTFRSSRRGAAGTTTLCGLHLLSPRILRFLPQAGFASIVEAYEAAINKGYTVGGVTVPRSYWSDVGSPESYLEAHAEIRERHRAGRPGACLFDPEAEQRQAALKKKGVRIRGTFAADTSCDVASGADIERTVLWPGASVVKGSRLSNVVVGRNTRVAGRMTHLALRGSVALDTEEREVARAAGLDPDRLTVQFLGTRHGSARTFSRLIVGSRRAILVRYETDREENALYAHHARFLERNQLPVPHVILDRPDLRMTLIEDGGDTALEHVARGASSGRLLSLYRGVIESIAQLHGPVTRRARQSKLVLMAPFSSKLYRWEIDLFSRHFLAGVAGLGRREERRIQRELAANAGRLHVARRVLLHRDLQSSNILIVGRRHILIDFQGMRYGPAAYDLASLLCDPYVRLPLRAQRELLGYYLDRVSRPREVSDLFWVAAVQRLAQALGAYGRLSVLPGGRPFRRYIPGAVEMLRRALHELDACPSLDRALGGVRL